MHFLLCLEVIALGAWCPFFPVLVVILYIVLSWSSCSIFTIFAQYLDVSWYHWDGMYKFYILKLGVSTVPSFSLFIYFFLFWFMLCMFVLCIYLYQGIIELTHIYLCVYYISNIIYLKLFMNIHFSLLWK